MEIRSPQAPIRFVATSLELPEGIHLREGSVVATRIRGGPSAPYLLLDGRKLPLPEGIPVQKGQRVFVRVTQVEPEIVLQIQPRADGGIPAGPAGRPDDTLSLISHLLRALGARMPSSPASFIGPGTGTETGPAASAARALLSLFSDSSGLGESFDALRSILERAVSEPSLVGPTRQLVQRLLDLLGGAESELSTLLRELAEEARRSPENRLAKSLYSKESEELARLKDSLGSQIARLLKEANLMEYMERTGQRGVLEQAVRAILQRLSGRDLQNLRGVDYPYLFFEVPFGKDAPIRRALIHFFGEAEEDGDGTGSRFKDATVALDVSTAKLGDVWVTLHVHGPSCACKFRAEREETLALVREFADELVNTLQEAGYEHASVAATSWHGSRVAETAASMRRFAGLDALA